VTGRRLAHLLLAVAGLLVALYPVTLGRSPSVTCRGVELQPGATCAKADGSAVQTFEDRAAAAGDAAPVILGVGLLVAVFGTGLPLGRAHHERAGGIRGERRRDPLTTTRAQLPR
jgi:hypothetical protein